MDWVHGSLYQYIAVCAFHCTSGCDVLTAYVTGYPIEHGVNSSFKLCIHIYTYQPARATSYCSAA